MINFSKFTEAFQASIGTSKSDFTRQNLPSFVAHRISEKNRRQRPPRCDGVLRAQRQPPERPRRSLGACYWRDEPRVTQPAHDLGSAEKDSIGVDRRASDDETSDRVERVVLEYHYMPSGGAADTRSLIARGNIGDRAVRATNDQKGFQRWRSSSGNPSGLIASGRPAP
jgi:hypothetical protein